MPSSIFVHNVEFIKLAIESEIPLEFWPVSPEAAIFILNNCSTNSPKTMKDIFKQKEHNFEVTIEFLKKNIPLKESYLFEFITSSEPDKLRFMYNYSNIIRKSINDYLENDEFLKAIVFNDIQTVKELQYKIDPNYCSKCNVSHFNLILV